MRTILISKYLKWRKTFREEFKGHIITEKIDSPGVPSNISFLSISSPYPKFDASLFIAWINTYLSVLYQDIKVLYEISLVINLEDNLLCHREWTFHLFWILQIFSKAIMSFYTPSHSVWEYPFLYSLENTCYCQTSKFCEIIELKINLILSLICLLLITAMVKYVFCVYWPFRFFLFYELLAHILYPFFC